MEDATGALKLHKCKGPARPGGRALSNLVPKYYGPGSEACTCDGADHQLSLPGRRKKFFKKSECGSPGGEGSRLWSPIRSNNRPGSWHHSETPDGSPVALATRDGSEEGRRSGGLSVPSAVKGNKAAGGDQPGAHHAASWGLRSETGSRQRV